MSSYCEVCEGEGTEFCRTECGVCGRNDVHTREGVCAECEDEGPNALRQAPDAPSPADLAWLRQLRRGWAFDRALARGAFVALAVVALGGCGGPLPLPTSGATACDRGAYQDVYVEAGVAMNCATAVGWVEAAEQITGVALGGIAVEFVTGRTLDGFGHPDAVGVTEGRTVAVLATMPATLVHEAIHVQRGPGHCSWSDPALLHMWDAARIVGAYEDACQHVTCSSHEGSEWSCQ